MPGAGGQEAEQTLETMGQLPTEDAQSTTEAVSPEAVSPRYAGRVGERLRAIRRQQGHSLQSVEATSQREFKASVLGAYERGERIISVLRLQRLASFYGVAVDQLLPRDAGPSPTVAAGRSDTVKPAPPEGQPGDGAGPVVIDLVRLEAVEAPEKDLISRYLRMIRQQRGDLDGRVLTIRDDDVRALARLFERDTPNMRQRMDELGIRA